MASHTEALAQLREDADVLLQQANGTRDRLTPILAQDSSGQVTAQLDAHGTVTEVKVGFTWDRALSREQLPAAVLEAVANARLAQLEQWAESYRLTEAQPTPRPRPGDDSHSLVTQLRERIDANGGTSDAAGRVVEELLNDVVQGLEEANQLLDEHAARVHRGRSGPGHVTATVTASADVQSVEYDERWLTGAHPGNVGRETTQAIQAAVRTARERGIAAAMRASKLGAVAREVLDLRVPSHP